VSELKARIEKWKQDRDEEIQKRFGKGKTSDWSQKKNSHKLAFWYNFMIFNYSQVNTFYIFIYEPLVRTKNIGREE